ncbi:MAG TPA: ABC transporter substrate-binding protein [Solirubrobacterales bacterium]|nr:ABC transporter substrate-binding protein [Solirubrobacterales bacterium]
MSRTWRLLALAVAALLAIGAFAAGCGGDDDNGNGEETTPTTEEPAADLGLLNEGTLTVGTDAPFPPFEIGRPPDITGYDIEVMDAIAEQLGVETEYIDTSFDTIFRDVAQGQFDIVAAASTITPGRERTVDFSDPYYEAQQALLVVEGSDIASVDDLAGTTVGTQDATTGEAYANDETDAETVRGFPEGPDAVAALATGQVEAVIIDQPVAVDAVEQQGGVEIAEEIPTEELYGFAMSPENQALREAVNEALTMLKEDGTITELYQKYFSAEPPASVLEGTHEPS